MTRARLEGMPLPLLQDLIQRESLDVSPHSAREDLVEALWEAFEEDRKEKEQLNSLITRIEEAKFALFDGDEHGYAPEDRWTLPETYDETGVSLILRDPNWAFVYWDVKASAYEELQAEYGFKGLILRVFESDKPHLTTQDDNAFFTIGLETPYGSQYINLPEQGKYYMVELRGQILEKETRLLARSKFIYAPLDHPSYVISSEGAKKLLELSGLSICEPSRGKPEPEQKKRIPQRIGDMDEL